MGWFLSHDASCKGLSEMQPYPIGGVIVAIHLKSNIDKQESILAISEEQGVVSVRES